MKLIISFLICFTTFSSLAQDSVQFVFNKRIDLNNGSDDVGLKTFYWNDGILGLGEFRDSSSRIGVALSYLDTQGNVIWNRSYFYPLNDTTHLDGFSIHLINDSSFYLAGLATDLLPLSTETSPIDYDLFLAKFNGQGDSLFFHFFPGEGKELPVNFLKTQSNDLLLFTYRADSEANLFYDLNLTSCIYRVNATETLDTILEYSSSLKSPGQLLEYDHNYYIGGTRKTALSNYHVKVFIDVFDANFIPVTTINPSITLNEYFNNLFLWQNKLYLSSLITAYSNTNSNAFYKNQIACLENGFYTDTVSFGPLSFINNFKKTVVINDSLVVTPHKNGGHHTLFFVDSSLTVREFAAGYPPYGTLLFHNYFEGEFAATPDGQIIGIGKFGTNQGEDDDHWIFLSTDVRTYLPESTAGQNELSNAGFTSYPVPFSSELTIQRREDIPATIQLIDLNGKCILEQSISKKTEKIATRDLPAGPYFFRLNENGVIQNATIIKE
ncbi:MAG: T9SS type A sorting domain-containing protein [Fluviicola sp.]